MVIVIHIIGTHRFTGGLAGFGISAKGLGGVFLRGLGYYAVGGGLTLFTLFLTVQICKGIGYDVIQKHSVLEMIEQKPPIHSLFALFFTAAIAAPIAEELMFRGLLQNFMVRLFADYYKIVQKVRTLQSASEKPSETNRTGNPEADDFRCRWMGIVVTSIIFGVFHAQWQQWPALFVLSMVLGYSYERRGSLLIPIFTHAFFNTLPLTVMVVKVYFCV
jgi:membrane protease YdiL (CAAX protease family)